VANPRLRSARRAVLNAPPQRDSAAMGRSGGDHRDAPCVRGLTVEYVAADRSVTACAEITLQLNEGENFLGVAGRVRLREVDVDTAAHSTAASARGHTAGQILLDGAAGQD